LIDLFRSILFFVIWIILLILTYVPIAFPVAEANWQILKPIFQEDQTFVIGFSHIFIYIIVPCGILLVLYVLASLMIRFAGKTRPVLLISANVLKIIVFLALCEICIVIIVFITNQWDSVFVSADLLIFYLFVVAVLSLLPGIFVTKFKGYLILWVFASIYAAIVNWHVFF